MMEKNNNLCVNIKDRKLIRNIGSKAILSVDSEGLRGYRDRTKIMGASKSQASELNNMKVYMESMKQLLLQILEKLDTQ